MTDFNSVIFAILKGNASVRDLVGTYTDGNNEILKIFSGLPPQREGVKANFPFIVFNHSYRTTPIKGRITKQYDVMIQVHAVAVTITEATALANAVTVVLEDFRSDNVNGANVQATGEVFRDFEMQDEETKGWFIAMNFRMKINVNQSQIN